MEFLKTCSTNAQAIGDFEAVTYHAFSVTRTTAPLEWPVSEDIRAVEAELRQEQRLVVQDASRPWLWLFQATTADKVGQPPPDLPALDRYQFQREQCGLIKATELVRPPVRQTNAAGASSTSAHSPSNQAPSKGVAGGGGRPVHGNAQSNAAPNDTSAIYELFTSSVVALVSYYLVRDHQTVALNYRTFVSRPSTQIDSDQADFDFSRLPFWLTNLSVHWTSCGTLIVSTFSLCRRDVRCLNDVDADEQKKLVGKCVRVAPNGSLAQVQSFDDPVDAASDDASQRMQRKRTRIGPLEQGVERWKSSVKRWLAWKGYAIDNLAKRAAWVKIRLANVNHTSNPSSASSAQPRDFLWPRALCFYYTDSTAEELQHTLPSLQTKALDWFETSNSTGFRDPLDAAQEWFLGKAERDKSLEARKKAKKAEEEASRRKEENSGLYPSSPLNSRPGIYGDLQAVSGVYPTPPDGIAPGTVVSSSDTPSVSGNTNVILQQGGTNPAINLSAPQESAASEALQPPVTSPEFPQPFEDYNAAGANDDLFEDMDEDGYEGDGVTDADFNFFDAQDDDIDMLDAPAALDEKPVPAAKTTKDVHEVPAPAEANAKQEVSDPLAALEDALATASRPVEEGSKPIKTEKVKEHPGAKQEQMAPPAAQPTASQPNRQSASTLKKPTPPLSPRHIKQALLPSPPRNKVVVQTPQEQSNRRHRDSVFDPLNFNRKMSLSDAKYHGGRFSVTSKDESQQDNEEEDTQRRIRSLRDLPLMTKLRYAIGKATTQAIPEITSLGRDYSDLEDSSSETSDTDDDVDEVDSIDPGPPSAGFTLPAKRKIPTEGNATPLSTTSFADSSSADMSEIGALQLDETALLSFEPSPWDWSLLGYPPPAEVSSAGTRYSLPSFSPAVSSMPSTPTSQPEMSMEPPDEKPLSPKDSIAVAQIVTDQIVNSTLDLFQENEPCGTNLDISTMSENKWHGTIKNVFSQSEDVTVTALASIHDVFPEILPQGKGQQRPPPRKPNDPTIMTHHVHQLNPPFIRVRRADSPWELLPPALAFWEPLGLGPVSSPKNVVPFCIYPHSASLRACVDSFLANVQLAFDSCKLGSHGRVETIPEYEGGLVPCKITASASIKPVMKSLRDTCVKLGKLLASKHTQMRSKEEPKIDAFVVYMMDPFGTPSSIWDLCSMFWTLFHTYGQCQSAPSRPDQAQKPDLVLQVVPMKYVASFEAPIILDTGVYNNLAREVYDRCPPNTPSGEKIPLSIYKAPSFQLEETIPRSIPLKLTADPPHDLLRENSYMHLGYAMSLDGAWITAAWTDNWGKSQTVVSYNLGTRIFGEIAKEIWQTTIEILSARRVTWRVCITKAGVMDREELETWVYLISCPTQLNVFATILTLDTEPPLKFTPTMSHDPVNPQSGNTPGSETQSPDAQPGLTPAPTPSADNTNSDPAADPDARLVDITDESWGIILAHRTHNSNSTTEFRPALISGLLVKRGNPPAAASPHPFTPDPEPGPIVIGINILWLGAVGSSGPVTTPFASAAGAEGVSPGGVASPAAAQQQQQQQAGTRTATSLWWTPTAPHRATAENLLREIMGQFRGLGLLAKLRGLRGTRMGSVPWHVAVAKRGVEGLGKCFGGGA